MKTYTQLQRQGYKHITIREQINSIKNGIAFINLRPIQQRGINMIEKNYNRKKYLNSDESEYLFNIYYNFVVNNFTYEDKKDNIITTSISKKHNTPHHIGMKMLNQLNT